MRLLFPTFLALSTPLIAAPEASPPPPAAAVAIRVNTIGFRPDAPKQATVAAPCGAFHVVRISDGARVFSGVAASPLQTPPSDTHETVQVLDFSAVTQPGEYRVEVPGVGDSPSFKIDAKVWNEPYQVVARAMYLWRCGTAVEYTWKGVTYRQAPCHLEDGWLDKVGGGHVRHPAAGGWHDAGDYNKYIVNAAFTLGMMLNAWEQFQPAVKSLSFDIPESGDSVPDLLNEVRWEVEWFLRMQLEDGRVYHKLSSPDFRYWGPAEKDLDPRYLSPWSTVATADFTAVLAKTARAWRTYDAGFADRCLAAARKSWAILQSHPKPVEPDLSAFKTGRYQASDGSHRLWAAVELWETTGEAEFLQAFESAAPGFSVSFGGPTWGTASDLAFVAYLTASRPDQRQSDLVKTVAGQLLGQARKIVETAQANGHARPLGVDRESWSWGGNGNVAAQTLLLHAADRLAPDPAYRATAQQSLSFLFGRNFHGRSYVTGLGANPPARPHDRRGLPAWPGYLVGGGWPDGRSWEDKVENYRVNEIAINWNGALIYALAAFIEP